MARQPPARLAHSARRFTARRVAAALAGGVPEGGHGFFGGAVLTVLLLAGGLALGRLHPATLPDAPLLRAADAGTLYLRRDGLLHPVLNLTSARLLAGDAAAVPAPDALIAAAARGPLLGIPGAPAALGPVLADSAGWAICDGAGTVLLAGIDPAKVGAAPAGALPVVSAASGSGYLLAGGRRYPAPGQPGARRVAGLLLDAIPLAGPADSAPEPIVAPGTDTICAGWAGGHWAVTAGAGLPLPGGAAAVLAGADGPGPALDGVYLPEGRIGYAQALDGAGHRTGPPYLIAATGVRYPIDDDAAHTLGLPAEPTGVPWPLLAALPQGPVLSRAGAGAAWDAISVAAPAG